jgi:hypothetical protein
MRLEQAAISRPSRGVDEMLHILKRVDVRLEVLRRLRFAGWQRSLSDVTAGEQEPIEALKRTVSAKPRVRDRSSSVEELAGRDA